jgi:murein DD-endopeptidase MepM/ murein hydrolase activator NlpD
MQGRGPARSVRYRLLVTSALTCVVVSAALTPVPAQAASFPSWSNVLDARFDERAKQRAIRELQSTLDSLRNATEAARERSQAAGTSFERAQRAVDAAVERHERLQMSVDRQQGRAVHSAEQAGQLSAQLARAGTTLDGALATGGDDVSGFLYGIGAMAKLAERARAIEVTASTDAGTLRSLKAQVQRAKTALANKADTAAEQMERAQKAADHAQRAEDTELAHKARLEAQLATLTSGRIRTEKEFAEGQRQRKLAIERAAREAAAKAAAEAAAQRPKPGAGNGTGAPGTGTPGTGGPGTGTPGTGGPGTGNPGTGSWVRPGAGAVVSAYGYRVHPITGATSFHAGVDMAAGCNTPIWAASAGTVEYVGWFGGYGNYVRINHGGDVKTAYGHIVNGGFRVRPGQKVAAGTLIALVGTTGASTGCHIHYETHAGSATTNPVPFMATRGVRL